MKKNLCAVLVIIFILTSLSTVFALDGKILIMQIGNQTMFVIENGSENSVQRETAPIVQNGSTLVPARAATELLGAKVDWNSSAKKVTITRNNTVIEMWIDSTQATVNGNSSTLAVAPKIIGSSTMIPVRFISENMGLHVLYDNDTKVIAISENPIDMQTVKSFNCVQSIAKPVNNTNSQASVNYYKKNVSVSGKNISADIIEVDMNSSVTVKTVLVGNKLNTTTSFANIINDYKPIAAINGNFFNAYDKIKDPVGTIMSDGQIVYGTSGLTSVGITQNNKVSFGKPAIFTKIYTTDSGNPEEYTAYEVNVLSQAGEQAVLYTPARGSSVGITAAGSVMTVENEKITAYSAVNPGETANIPSNGYIVFFSSIVTSTEYFRVPELGRSVKVKYVLFKPDEENFDMENAFQMISGAPRLVKQGAIDNSPLESGFAGDARFMSNSSPRTAIGKTADNKLLLVSTSCTIDQLKQLMLAIGSIDAVNIDGGASNAMYYSGKFIKQPGRELTSVILIN